MAITKHSIGERQDVFIADVLSSVVSSMQVPILPLQNPITYYTVNLEIGRNNDIIDSLLSYDNNQRSDLKYPLIAVLMPIPEKNSSGFLEVNFQRIVFANLTKTNTGSEKIFDKYSSDGVFKTILRPCFKEFIKQLAFSVYTGIGDPDMYDYTYKEIPSKASISEQIPNDFVDIVEILDLKVILNNLKQC